MAKPTSHSDKPATLGLSDFENLYAMTERQAQQGSARELRSWLLATKPTHWPFEEVLPLQVRREMVNACRAELLFGGSLNLAHGARDLLRRLGEKG